VRNWFKLNRWPALRVNNCNIALTDGVVVEQDLHIALDGQGKPIRDRWGNPVICLKRCWVYRKPL
jgi:hypothetical protein